MIEANQLIGTTTRFLTIFTGCSSRQPIDHLAYSYLIFNISSQERSQYFW
ncbi:MAG UNVERIFIED_CONTAM: hypothetical protein LVR29_10185 [Microcystis novacekii LVE1205-3]